MARKKSKRGLAYQKFLATKVWKDISARKKAMVPACEDCGGKDRLQAHHIRYPERWEDTTMEDLKVLCRLHHRMAHGLSVATMRPFEMAWAAVTKKMRRYKDRSDIPTHVELVSLVAAIEDEHDEEEARAIFRQVAMFRISEPRWSSWVRKSKDIRFRLWPWARLKLERMKKEVASVR